MSTARKVLLIIAFVFSIICAIGLAICTVVFFSSINDPAKIQKILDGFNRSSTSIEDGKTIVTILGVMFAILTAFELINAGLSIKGKSSNRTGLMILNIIFGVLSGIYINSLGAIFGLIDLKKTK